MSDAARRGLGRLAAAALLLSPILFDATAEARSTRGRTRSRAATQLRQAPPEDPDDPAEAWSVDGTFGSVLGAEHRAARQDTPGGTGFTSTSVLAMRLGLPQGFALQGVLHLEPPETAASTAPVPPHAAWVETLNLRWQAGPVVLFGGKIHPRFGAAWFRVPGFYGADFAGDYELREKLGGGAQVDIEDVFDFPDAVGDHELRVEAFGADTTDLSGALFAPRWGGTDAAGNAVRRWRNTRALGGADNAPGAAGMVASLVGTGIDLPGDASFGYSLALSRRDPGADATLAGRGRRETGQGAALFAEIGLPLGMRLKPLVEVARQDASGGFAGQHAAWGTASLTLVHGPLEASVITMRRRLADGDLREAARERAANLTLDLGQLTGADWLKPVSLSLDWRRLTLGGRSASDYAGGVVVSFDF